MSDKYIQFGPGKEVDPDRYSPESKNGAMYLRVDSARILRALQQREERIKEANQEMKKFYGVVLRHKGHQYANGKLQAIVYIYTILNGIAEYEAIEALEGTNGE